MEHSRGPISAVVLLRRVTPVWGNSRPGELLLPIRVLLKLSHWVEAILSAQQGLLAMLLYQM